MQNSHCVYRNSEKGEALSAFNVLQFLGHVWLFVTPQTAAHPTPLSMECFRQEDWSGLPFPTPCTINGEVQMEAMLVKIFY